MTVTFAVVPKTVIVRRELRKAGHRYFALLNEEGCRYLSEEFERRLSLGHTLALNSPVISHFDAKKENTLPKAISAGIRSLQSSWVQLGDPTYSGSTSTTEC